MNPLPELLGGLRAVRLGEVEKEKPWQPVKFVNIQIEKKLKET